MRVIKEELLTFEIRTTEKPNMLMCKLYYPGKVGRGYKIDFTASTFRGARRIAKRIMKESVLELGVTYWLAILGGSKWHDIAKYKVTGVE